MARERHLEHEVIRRHVLEDGAEEDAASQSIPLITWLCGYQPFHQPHIAGAPQHLPPGLLCSQEQL